MMNLLNQDFSRKLALVCSLMVTLFTALVGALGADANIRASNANRQSQVLATEITQELQRTGLQSNYELQTLAMVIKYSSEAIALEMASLDLIKAGNTGEAQQMINRAQALQYQVARLDSLSALLNDPRYAIPDSMIPDLERYIQDLAERMVNRVKEQNAASDLYARYDLKSTNYVSIMTLLSIILFLLGLAQVVSHRLRLGLVGVTLLLFAAASLWTIITLMQ